VRRSRRRADRRPWRFADRCDELVAAPGQGLDISRSLRVVPQEFSDLIEVALDGVRLNVGSGPHRFEKLLLGDQPPGVLCQVTQHRERLGPHQNALVFRAVPVPPTDTG